jgi:N-carbamoylputrescine amidase
MTKRAVSRTIQLGVIQLELNRSRDEAIQRSVEAVRKAASDGAQVILLPELFEGPYFCTLEKEEAFSLAAPLKDHPTLLLMQQLACELEVVLPVSLFEREGPHYYNTVAMIDAGGELLGSYRKSHIPDGPGYEEKFYFRPGNTGFKVWQTRFASIGVGICWDQWFPECARSMVLQGAEVLLYPTAIGTEPAEPELDTRAPWRRVMQGHAVANCVPVAAANRVGEEPEQSFYGSSFICDALGELCAEASSDAEAILLASLDLRATEGLRASMGFFRDRRPDLYGEIVKSR